MKSMRRLSGIYDSREISSFIIITVAILVESCHRVSDLLSQKSQ